MDEISESKVLLVELEARAVAELVFSQLGLPRKFLIAGSETGRLSSTGMNTSSRPKRNVVVDDEAMHLICSKANVPTSKYPLEFMFHESWNTI
jgi:hypothetical protein